METESIVVKLDHNKFANFLRNSGLTQEEFAEELCISDRYVRTLISQDKNISVDLAYNISKKCGCPIESILKTETIE